MSMIPRDSTGLLGSKAHATVGVAIQMTSIGSLEAVKATTSRISSLDSQTLTPPTAIPSRA